MNKMILKADLNIENMIYEIRGKQVILDSDLAMLYECANGTKDINKAAKRNIEKFPTDFYFQLTKEEVEEILRFQNGTLNKSGNLRGQHLKYMPYVFTEQGVAMLSSVLRTKVATEVSVSIMRTFVAMKKYISSNLIEQKYINNQVIKNTEEIKLLKETFQKFDEKRKINEIYFNGQIFDAYSKIQEILNDAKEKIIIIDSYADNTILDIIKRLNVSVTIVTKQNKYITKQDVEKYNKQYHNLKVIYNNDFHDRYFIIDDKHLYHCGTSINRIGYKTFSINLINDNEVCLLLFKKINKIIKNYHK